MESCGFMAPKIYDACAKPLPHLLSTSTGQGQSVRGERSGQEREKPFWMFTTYIGLGSSTAGKPYLIGPYNNKNAMSDFVDKWENHYFCKQNNNHDEKVFLIICLDSD